MSRYRVDRIRGFRNVKVLTQTQISDPESRDGHA